MTVLVLLGLGGGLVIAFVSANPFDHTTAAPPATPEVLYLPPPTPSASQSVPLRSSASADQTRFSLRLSETAGPVLSASGVVPEESPREFAALLPSASAKKASLSDAAYEWESPKQMTGFALAATGAAVVPGSSGAFAAIEMTPVPEPSTGLFLLAGAGLLALANRFRFGK